MRNWKPEPLLVALVLGLAGCGTSTPPEERVRTFVAETETLAEERKYVELVDRIAADYLDAHGNDRIKAVALLRAFYLRNRSVHLLTRIDSITLPAPERAIATIYVAITKRPPEGAASLPDADLFRVEVSLAADGDSYEILQTRWERASAADVVF